MGRTARGVRGISLRGDDEVVGAVLVETEKQLVTITENGFGKRTDFDDFRSMKNRGGVGVVCHNITDKTGKLAGINTVGDDDDLMMITNSGTIIRTPVKDIPTYARGATGVIVMRLAEGQNIVNFTKVASAEEEEEELKKAEAMAEVEKNAAPDVEVTLIEDENDTDEVEAVEDEE